MSHKNDLHVHTHVYASPRFLLIHVSYLHRDAHLTYTAPTTSDQNDLHVHVSSRPRCSYTKQVLDEVLRYSLLGTFTLRYAERDLTLRGFHVPADAAVIQAIGVTHRDPRLWPDPER